MGKMREILPPEQLMVQIGSVFPDIWREADRFRAMRGKEIPDWSREVFLPIPAWHEMFSNFGKLKSLPPGGFSVLQLCAFLAAWRPAQDVVRFDPRVYSALSKTSLMGDLPCDVLWRLPAWSVYVQTQNLEKDGNRFDGFLAMLDENEGRRHLRILFMGDGVNPYFEQLALGDWSLQEAIDLRKIGGETKNVDRAGNYLKQADRKPYPALATAISLLLYICAYGFAEERGAASGIVYPAAKKVKNGWRLFPPDKPKIHDMGQEVGEQIRRMEAGTSHATGSHQSPRPHLRRAHWHGFWSGPRKDPEKRKFELSWLPPIPVAMAEEKLCQ